MKKIIIAVIAVLIVIGAILGIATLMGNSNEKNLQVSNENNNRELIANSEQQTNNEMTENTETNNNSKILVAYFSKTENTKTIADLIHANVGGDIFRIQTVESYPDDYRKTTEVAKKEQEENARPELIDKVENIEQYDMIFLGYPNWWGTMPMAVFTFLEQYNFDGKTVIPFCTHEGSALGRSENDIKQTIPNTNMLKGLAIRGSNVKSSSTKKSVDEWIDELGIKE